MTYEPGDKVMLKLYPELGVGEVLSVTQPKQAFAIRSAKVHWPDAKQTSTHSFAAISWPRETAAIDAREAIAACSGTCTHLARHAAPHDHVQCLLDADNLIAALAAAGFQLIGITELANLQEATA